MVIGIQSDGGATITKEPSLGDSYSSVESFHDEIPTSKDDKSDDVEAPAPPVRRLMPQKSFSTNQSTRSMSSDDASAIASGMNEIGELKYLRERRMLRQSQPADLVLLQYHMVGASLNLFLCALVLLFICLIGRSGGLCIRDFQVPNVFDSNQVTLCDARTNETGPWEVCNDDGTSQCYFPYY